MTVGAGCRIAGGSGHGGSTGYGHGISGVGIHAMGGSVTAVSYTHLDVYKRQVNNTWHHSQDGHTLQEVDKAVHKEFTHRGGMSLNNIKRGELK